MLPSLTIKICLENNHATFTNNSKASALSPIKVLRILPRHLLNQVKQVNLILLVLMKPDKVRKR